VFRFADAPTVNDLGQVAFHGVLPQEAQGVSPRTGVWVGTPGSVHVVAISGAAPTGSSYDSVSTGPLLNGRGDVQFTAGFRGAQHDRLGLYVAEGAAARPGGAVRQVAITDGTLPGLGDDVWVTSLSTPLRLGPAGPASALVAFLDGSKVFPSNGSGLWSGTADNLRLVARAGDPAPGTEGDTRFGPSPFSSGMTFGSPTLDRQGNLTFFGHLVGEGVTPASSSGVWFIPAGGTPTLLARNGQSLPGIPTPLTGFSSPNSVANGHVAMNATLWGDTSGRETIVAGDPTHFRIVAREGEIAPGTDRAIRDLGGAVINSAGDVAFAASMDNIGSGEPYMGLWAGAPASPSLLARSGDPAPGAGPGLTFSWFETPSLNDRGQVAFVAGLAGEAVTPDVDLSVWATDPSGELHLIAREGDLLDVGGGELRRVRRLQFYPGTNGGEDGGVSSFGDGGHLVFVAHFTDDTSAIFRAAVPEPAAVVWLGPICAAALLRRRRNSI
jgi:hypothetical protein